MSLKNAWIIYFINVFIVVMISTVSFFHDGLSHKTVMGTLILFLAIGLIMCFTLLKQLVYWGNFLKL